MAAPEFSGEFIDPRGLLMTLRAPNEYEYRQLVTKKLAQGWKQASGKAAAPVVLEQVLAYAPEPEKVPESVVLETPLELPTAEERAAALSETLGD